VGLFFFFFFFFFRIGGLAGNRRPFGSDLVVGGDLGYMVT